MAEAARGSPYTAITGLYRFLGGEVALGPVWGLAVCKIVSVCTNANSADFHVALLGAP